MDYTRYTRYNINNKLVFIGSFQFLSSSLDLFIKNVAKNDFKYLNQEFDNNAVNLLKQKEFDLH